MSKPVGPDGVAGTRAGLGVAPPGLPQVGCDAHPLGQEGRLGLKDHAESGAGQGEVGQVDGVPPGEVGGPDAEGAHGDDGMVTLHEERKVPGR